MVDDLSTLEHSGCPLAVLPCTSRNSSAGTAVPWFRAQQVLSLPLSINEIRGRIPLLRKFALLAHRQRVTQTLIIVFFEAQGLREVSLDEVPITSISLL
jgi:hypothetical protein